MQATRVAATSGFPRPVALSPSLARPALAIVIAAAVALGAIATGAAESERAVAAAGADLTRLLRMMALLKTLMSLAVIAAVLWRFGAPVAPARFAAYAAACTAMAAGPVLIWDMAYVGSGAALLHGGLLAGVVLLWRDPSVARRLAGMIAARRAAAR
jgi:hypothetical protein